MQACRDEFCIFKNEGSIFMRISMTINPVQLRLTRRAIQNFQTLTGLSINKQVEPGFTGLKIVVNRWGITCPSYDLKYHQGTRPFCISII